MPVTHWNRKGETKGKTGGAWQPPEGHMSSIMSTSLTQILPLLGKTKQS